MPDIQIDTCRPREPGRNILTRFRSQPHLDPMFKYFPLLAILFALVSVGCSRPAEPTVPFFRAVESGNLDQLRRHIYHGADVTQLNAEGETALHIAARQGRMVIARELLKSGASVDATDANGHSPSFIALAHGRTKVAELLLDRGAGDEPQDLLHALVAADRADRDVLALLVRRGANLNALDDDGYAPLHRAIQEGRDRQVKRLIVAGVDINLADGSGSTPLSLAESAKLTAIAALLREYGARP